VRGSREIEGEAVKEAESGDRSTGSSRRLMVGMRRRKCEKIKGN
jgi:hypothetical protein